MLVFALFDRNTECFFLIAPEMFETSISDKNYYHIAKTIFLLSDFKLPDFEKIVEKWTILTLSHIFLWLYMRSIVLFIFSEIQLLLSSFFSFIYIFRVSITGKKHK